MRHLLVSLAILLAFAPWTYAAVSAGVSLGYQPYSAGDSARLTPGAEVAVTLGAVGVQVVGDYTNRSYLGKVTAVHVNAIYTAPVGENVKASVGAGVTRVDAEATELGAASENTWNISAELARSFSSTELFARVRYFTYAFAGFRGQAPGSPAGPAVSVGVRYWFRR